MSLSLPALYGRILTASAKCVQLPAVEDETQELVASTLKDLRTLRSGIEALSILSPGETLEDISTGDLTYLFVPYVFSEVQGRLKATTRVDRMNSLIVEKKYIESFISLLENYEIIPEEERKLFDRKLVGVADFAKRRELKINQYKKEKDLQARIETIRKRRGQKAAGEEEQTGFGLISSLLPKPQAIQGGEELDSDTEEILRETTLLVLRLFYTRAMTQLQAMEQELELLRNAPPSPIMGPESQDSRDKQRNVEENEWKLDIPLAGGPDGKGPLMDARGKPLRPFTILPSDAGERARLQAQVFGPGHRLPTMSIDEYLEIERQRGNMITGGGPASQAAPTSSEQLAIDAEMDGTLEGDLKEEVKRQKDENWARYTDENPRGAGNTMNRG